MKVIERMQRDFSIETQLFFELLQVAIGNRTQLSVHPTAQQWEALHALCKKQALVGVGFVGFKHLPQEQTENAKLASRWYFQASKLIEKNAYISRECQTVCKQFKQDGFLCWVLKGQSNQVYYPEQLRGYRMAGDIDLWVVPKDGRGHQTVIRYVQQQCHEKGILKIPQTRYHHIDMPTRKVDVEVHFRPTYFTCPWHNRRFENWYHALAQKMSDNDCEWGFPVPDTEFNLIYQMVHIYRHLFCEGIGLRQILDYYFVLQTAHQEHHNYATTTEMLTKLGMKRFVAAIMWVMQEVFAMPDEYILCTPDEELGSFILDEILLSGNFGQGDQRNENMRSSSREKRFFLLTRRNTRFLRDFPTEVFFDPWRRIEARFINLKYKQ